MRRKTMKQRGGMAPLTYTMTPGANVQVYGRFPTEIATSPSAVADLDVFYRSALSQGCGTENSSLTVPEDMGSNKVGGHRVRGSSSRRVRRRSTRRRSTRRSTKQSRRTYRRRGGYVALLDRPYLATPYPNLIQSATEAWKGNPDPVPMPANPVMKAWNYSTANVHSINPSVITNLYNQAFPAPSPAGSP